jgi:predicted CXXCH cytochrome family protein
MRRTIRFLPKDGRLLILITGLVVLAVALVGLSAHPAVAAPLSQEVTNDACLSCHSQPGMTIDLGGEPLLLTIDANHFNASVHGANGVSCVSCHTDITGFPHPKRNAGDIREMVQSLYKSTEPACANCHEEQATNALDSVHQQAIDSGNLNAAVCSDCHNPHYQQPIAQMSRVDIANVCARCHSQIFADYKASVHGLALVGTGNPDVPICIDCHGVHNIQNPNTAQFHNAIPELCAKCHTNPAIMNKYGLSTQVLNTYVADFHGTTVTLFEETGSNQIANKAVCTDCHGVHDIRDVNDPQAGIALKQNLLVKCQRCHPNATTNFPDAWLGHYVPSPTEHPLVYFVNLFYKIFIPLVIGGMLAFVITDASRRLIERRKGGSH